jgi:hypothetical protein
MERNVMTANRLSLNRLFPVFLSRLLPLLMLACAGGAAVAQADPPARVGSLSHVEGAVVLAPAGDTEWSDAVLNRPITRGDRLWTDPGARAEVHLGSAVLHLDDETFVDVTALDQDVLQASLNEGTVNARVRQLNVGENFEIDTPNLAFRAAQAGDYRVDVDPDRATTRVAVRSGMALVYGAGGQPQQMQAGQQITFAGRDLEHVSVRALPPDDGFDRWAADRNQREDQAIAARYVPRDVVGYHQLDPYGSWAHDPSYGDVWFPRVTVADWAPYRYGRWEWIRPWGWTWIDDAPWGFAPFHYGRWAVIGSRWCWVPGHLGPRPIYSPALVVFVGGGSSGWNFSAGSGPGIAWYPLAPGEAWRPLYRASPVYVRDVNRNIVVHGGASDPVHFHRRRADAVTAVTVEDFSRGRPVHRHWSRVNPAEVARAPIAALPAMPERRRFSDAARSVQPRVQPPVHSPAPAIVARPHPPSGAAGVERRDFNDQRRPGARSREERQTPPRRNDEQQRSLIDVPRGQPQVRQEERRQERQEGRGVGDEQRRQQLDQLQRQQQERARRDQQVIEERMQREQQTHVQRQIEEQRRAQQLQLQREHALRQQQAAQERIQHQQELQQRAAQQQVQREQAMRQQQAAQERSRQQQEMQERAAQQQQRVAPSQRQLGAAPAVQPAQTQRGDGREAGEERRRQAQERHEQRRSRGEDEGRGRGQGQWQGRGG